MPSMARSTLGTSCAVGAVGNAWLWACRKITAEPYTARLRAYQKVKLSDAFNKGGADGSAFVTLRM